SSATSSSVKRWIGASMPRPACLVQKPKRFCTGGPPPAAAGHILCLAIRACRFIPRGRATRDGQLIWPPAPGASIEAGRARPPGCILSRTMADLPESRAALYQLAVSQRRAQRLPEAIATLQRLESLYPPFGSSFEELGFCLLMAREPAKATQAFARAVELNNCLLESWRALADLHRAAGQLAHAQHATAQVAVLAALPREIQLACSSFFD